MTQVLESGMDVQARFNSLGMTAKFDDPSTMHEVSIICFHIPSPASATFPLITSDGVDDEDKKK